MTAEPRPALSPYPEPVEEQTNRRTTPAPLRGLWRLARIATLGGVSMLLATAAHLVGGGRLPSAGVLLVTTFLVGLTAVTLTARRCRYPRLSVLLAIQQIVLHEVFAAASAVSTAAPMTGGAGSHAPTLTVVVDPHVAAGMSTTPTMPTPIMLGAHVAATLATAWLLACGERWVWGLCDRIVRAARSAPTPRVRRPRSPRPLPPPLLFGAALRSGCASRGPPALAWSV